MKIVSMLKKQIQKVEAVLQIESLQQFLYG